MRVLHCIRFKVLLPEDSCFSEAMGRDAQQAAKCLRLLRLNYKSKGGFALPPAKSLKKFNPKMEAFKRVFELTCK